MRAVSSVVADQRAVTVPVDDVRLGDIGAVVSRGGRVDLASERLPSVTAPTPFVVGGADTEGLELTREALAVLTCPDELAVIEGAGHLFEREGALEGVADLAAAWFATRLS